MNKKTTLLTLTGLLALTAATTFAAGKTYVFGVIAKSNNNPVFQAAKHGAEDEAKALSAKTGDKVTIDWRTPNEEDPQKQVQAIEQLVNQGAAGIAVSCSDANKLTGAIDKAAANGVPVVTFDSDAPKSKRLTCFGTDDRECGAIITKELIKFMGGKGVIAILGGNQNAPNLQKRVQAARDEAKKYPGIKVLDAFYHKETPEDAAAKVEEVQNAHPEITGWSMIGGWPLFTANALKWPAGTVKVVACDALPAQLGYVKDGHVQELLAQQCYEWGGNSVDELYNYLAKHEKPAHFIKAALVPVTKENVDQYAKNWNKWLGK
jgi:ribose transport system substrate-binding protein